MSKYDVFLSYSHTDAGIAEMLSKRIRRFKTPKRLKHRLKKLEVFRDKERLTAGADLSNLLVENLSASRHLVLLVSSASKRSSYVNSELAAYIKAQDIKSIVFVLVEGEFTDNLPPALQQHKIEPLYIDLRNLNKKKFRYETLRLIAAILNVDFTLLSLEDLKYRRRQRQIAIAGAAVMLIIAACVYFIVTTNKYHWKQVNQPKMMEEIMPVHEIVVNKKDPSLVLFKGVNAKYGTNPRPTGESIRSAENILNNDQLFGDGKLKAYLVEQKEMSPLITVDFRIADHEGRGIINIFGILSDKDSVYLFKNLYFKGKDKNGSDKEVKSSSVLYLKNKDVSDLYPVLQVLAEENIADLDASRFEATIHNNINQTSWKEIFEFRQNDEGYAEMVEVWGPVDIVFSNDPKASILIGEDSLDDVKQERDLWDNITKDPNWISFEKREKKKLIQFWPDSDIDSLPAMISRQFREKIPVATKPPSVDRMKPCFKGEIIEINALVSGFGKQKGLILEIKSIMDNEINEEKISCYLYKNTESKDWMTLQLPSGLSNSGIIDMVMLDSSGKKFMILTNNKGFFTTINEGKSFEESNYGEISFQNGPRVKTLVTPNSTIYAFIDRNTSVNEGVNNLFVLEKRNWIQRLRIGLIQLISD